MHEHATREEIEHLRSQISQLRKHYPSDQPAVQTLVDSMDRLHRALDRLVTLLEGANKEIYDEYDKGLHDELAKLERLSEQNEKIARGIVAIADMLKRQPLNTPSAPINPAPLTSQFSSLPEPVVPPTQLPTSAWQPPSAPAVQPNFRSSDESPFMQQPVVNPISPSQPAQAAARPYPPIEGVQYSAPAPSPGLPSLPSFSGAPTSPGLQPRAEVPAPLPPPPAPARSNEPMSFDQRRSLLEKFSFR